MSLAAEDPNPRIYLINGYDVGAKPELWADPALDYRYEEQPDGTFKQGLRIDGVTRTVTITFKGLEKSEYYLCGDSDPVACVTNRDHLHKFSTQNGEINIKVCGDGTKNLKGHAVNSKGELTGGDHINSPSGCNEQKDYFHEGEQYRLFLFSEKSAEGNNLVAEFFVRHSFPVVKISSTNGSSFSPEFPISVSLWGRRPGGDKDNNYEVRIEGVNNSFEEEHCIATKKGGITDPRFGTGDTVGIHSQGINYEKRQIIQEHLLTGTGHGGISAEGSPAEPKTYGSGKSSGLGQGSFLLKINERKGDTRPLGISTSTIGIGGSCEGGYSFIYIYFKINKKFPKGIEIYNVVYDPNNSDREDLDEAAFGNFKQFPPPCDPASYDKDTKSCGAVNTAIGTISTDPQDFIQKMFTFVLTLASFGGIIIIIYSGYVLMTSGGNKEKIQGARETITSAILGLLFIIFSIVILEIIGVDILRIPGFQR